MMTLLILLLALAGDVLLGVLLWRSGRAPAADQDALLRALQRRLKEKPTFWPTSCAPPRPKPHEPPRAPCGTWARCWPRARTKAARPRPPGLKRLTAPARRARKPQTMHWPHSWRCLKTDSKGWKIQTPRAWMGCAGRWCRGSTQSGRKTTASSMKSAARWMKSWRQRCKAGFRNPSAPSAPSLSRCTKAWARCRRWPPMWAG